MSAESTTAKKYDVGYGKPPKAGRFKSGQSGNPKGRKKGAKSLQGVMRAALAEKVTVEIAGKKVLLTKLDALLKRLVASALSGDLGATRQLFGMMHAAGMHQEMEEALAADHMSSLSAEDQTILERYGAMEPVLEKQTLTAGTGVSQLPTPTGDEGRE